MLHTRPAVQEAIIFARFETTVGPELYSMFYQAVKESYPTFVPGSQHTLTVDVGPGGPVPARQIVQQFMRYSRTDKPLVLTLTPNTLSLHILPKYPGWQEVLTHLRYAWVKLLESVPARTVNQIGMKYINAIPCESEEQPLGDWLKANPFIPAAVLDSSPFVPYRIHKNATQGRDVYIVTLAKQPTPTDTYGVFIWEIERVQQGAVAPEVDAIIEIADRLHNDVRGDNGIFDTAVGTRLLQWMNPEGNQ